MNVEAYEDWSMGPGNDEEVHLYDVEPGIYYVTAYTWGRAFDFSIVADLTPMPSNGEASDAIALTAGVPYGPFPVTTASANTSPSRCQKAQNGWRSA